MEVAAAPTTRVLHPGAAAFTVDASRVERRVGLLFAVTGLALIVGMGVLGLIMAFIAYGRMFLKPIV